MVNRYNRLSHVPTSSAQTIYATLTHASHFIFTGITKNNRIWYSGATVAAAKNRVDCNCTMFVMGHWNTSENVMVSTTVTSTYNVVRNSPHSSSRPLMMKYRKPSTNTIHNGLSDSGITKNVMSRHTSPLSTRAGSR